MFHVAAAFAAFVPKGLLVGHTVAIGVAVEPDVLSVGFVDQQFALSERQNHSRQKEVIDEHGVLVEHAVAIGVFMQGDPALGRLFSGCVGILHVGAHFRDEHAAVAIEDGHDRFRDMRFGENRFQRISGLEVKGLQRLLNRQCGNRCFGKLSVRFLTRERRDCRGDCEGDAELIYDVRHKLNFLRRIGPGRIRCFR